MVSPDGNQFWRQSNWSKLGIAAIVLALGLNAVPYDAAMAGEMGKLLHNWAWNKNKLSPEAFKAERVFSTLTFNKNHTVDSWTVMADGIGPGMGEALGTSGSFRLNGKKLLITGRAEGGNWPTDIKGPRVHYMCRIEFSPDGNRFRLDGCAIAGEWIRSDIAASK
jgi:hypothetical protein